jgi:hypothetical protein
LENSQWLTELAHINHKYECWTEWLTSLISLRCGEFIGTKLKLWPLLLVSSLAELIKLRLIIDWHVIGVQTEIAGCFGSSFDKLHEGVYISLASVTSEWSIFSVINQRNICYLILIFLLSHLCKGLDTEAEGHIALSLE